MQSPGKFQSPGKEGPAGWNPVITGDGDSTIKVWHRGKFSTGSKSKYGDEKRCEVEFAQVSSFLCCLGSVEKEENGSHRLTPFSVSSCSKVQRPDVIVDPAAADLRANQL
jgi:hypothetical protein